jgi:uncharacterized protein
MNKDQAGRVDLHYAALEDRRSDVAALLTAGQPVDSVDTAGFSPLHFAAQQGSVDAAEVLLSAGAEVNLKNNGGMTPLFLSIFSGVNHLKIVTLLCLNGANPNAQSNQGDSPYSYAKDNKKEELLSIFDSISG